MQEQATADHKWLLDWVGTWKYASECQMPDGSTATVEGRETVRAVGDLWILAERVAGMPGMDGEMDCVTSLGFDTRRGVFRGSWAGSPMTHMYQYVGSLDDERRVLTLDCTGPSSDDPETDGEFQDVYTVVSPNERRMQSQMRQDDGSWLVFMEATYTRVED